MSTYSAAVGMNRAARVLLLAIDLHPIEIPRLRDVWVNRELTEVSVFTRTGGGNRAQHEAENGWLRLHPGFIRDADWGVDPTYAEWVFSVPEDCRQVLLRDIEAWPTEDQEMIYAALTLDATAKWQRTLAALAKVSQA